MDVTKTNSFKLSLYSSIILLLSMMYAQRFWSTLWIIYGFIEIALIAFFAIALVWSVVFWIKNKYKKSYLPFAISITSLALIIILPLNWIRNRIEFFVWKSNYEQAALLIYKNMPDSTRTTYKLPDKYEFLSAGGGEALVENSSKCKGVLFFTFRGIPDGMKGFVKILDGKSINTFTESIGSEVDEIKVLGDNWYYISGQ